MTAAGIITLTTDFGLHDEYVGVLKGVILTVNPALRLIDLCHALPPQDIAAGARLLQASWRFFPAGSVHLAVVDPGVGGARRILALSAGEHFFVGPDNGIFTPWLCGIPAPQVYQVSNASFFLPQVSATFHGRDIMAPVAAALAGGLTPDRLGPPVIAGDCVRIMLSRARRGGDALHGQVTHCDAFGNLISDIAEQDLADLRSGDDAPLEVELSGAVALRLVHSYAEGRAGEALALIGSRGVLEIAVNGGSAADVFRLGAGTAVMVRRTAGEA